MEKEKVRERRESEGGGEGKKKTERKGGREGSFAPPSQIPGYATGDKRYKLKQGCLTRAATLRETVITVWDDKPACNSFWFLLLFLF